ncbi:MAG: tetratricopeptide repeat protein [Myxococcales bacterium]
MLRSAAAFACALALACSRKEPAPKASPDAGALARLDANDPKALLAAVDQMQGQLKDKPKTFEVLSALGNLYYENGRYLDAVDSFRQALAMSAPAEARAQELRDEKVKPAKDLPLECRRGAKGYGLDQIAQAARKLDGPRELRCLESALQIAIEARSRRGNALYLVGNPEGAMAEHRRVLAESPDHPESLFFVGAILLEQSRGEKAKLTEGKKYWRRLLAVAPDSPRATLVKESLPRAEEIFAPKAPAAATDGSMTPGHPDVSARLPSGHPPVERNAPDAPMADRGTTPGQRAEVSPQELQAVAEAAQNTERTPELEKGLDQLTAQAESLLDQGKYQEARDAIVRVMPMRPNDARTAAAMGAAMRGLGRDPIAERTLARALQLDPKQPRALYEMGKLLAARGDKAAAADKLRAAQSADPKFARSHAIAQELAKLR